MMTAAESTTINDTFVIERDFPHPPDRVFAAFAEPARKRRWYAEGDRDILEFAMDFSVGGNDRLHYRFSAPHPIAGSEIVNEASYADIVPGRRIIATAKMSLDGMPIMISLLTFEFLPSATGTDLLLTNQSTFTDWPQGAEMIQQGWKTLLDHLEKELAR